MNEDRGFLGGICDNAEILFFILVFLLLFYSGKPMGYCDNKGC